MPEPTLGLIMILRDEAANLPRSLVPVAGCFDEVVAVDTGSTDQTRQICADLGARVYEFTWQDDFAAARNFSVAQARADWLFWLDGDNAITSGDVIELRRRIPPEEPAVIWAQERVEPSGQRLWQKRCFPRHPAVRFKGRVHEQLVHPPTWPGLASPVVVRHWGYHDPKNNLAKGRYYLGLLQKSLAEDPTDFYAHFQIARCHVNLRQFPQAAEHLSCLAGDHKARELNPELWVYGQILWAQALARLGREAEGVEVLDRLLAIRPEHGLVHYQRGRMAYGAGDFATAAAHLKAALDLGLAAPVVDLDSEKTLYLACYFLGQALIGLGEKKQAVAALSQAVARDPHNPAARTELARLFLELGETARARGELAHVLATNPQDRPARRLWQACGEAA